MKKLYSLLALLMFTCFVTTFSALVLNKTIDKAANSANIALDTATARINESLLKLDRVDQGKLFHKAYFANCFPYVCAKFSFASLYVKSSEYSRELMKFISKEVKYDLGTTSYFIVKYNPITGKLFAQAPANNVIVNKNGEKYASVYYESLNFEVTGDTLDYYQAVMSNKATIEDVISKLSDTVLFEVKGLKVSLEDERFKADKLKIYTDTLDENSAKLSKAIHFEVKGATENNNPIKTDAEFELNLENVSKPLIEQTVKLLHDYEAAFKAASAKKPKHALKSNAEKVVSYMEALINAVKLMPELKTNINLSKFKVNVFNEAENQYVLLDVDGSANISLDAKLNPEGLIDAKIKSDDKSVISVLEGAEVKIPRLRVKGVNLFKYEDSGVLSLNIQAKDGKVNFNQSDEVKVDGLLGKYIKMANRLVRIAKRSIRM